MQVACRLESNLYARDPIWMSGSLSADCNSYRRFLARVGSGPVVPPVSARPSASVASNGARAFQRVTE